MIQFGEYRPDVSDYQQQFTNSISNVVPRGDGYGPVKSFSGITDALAANCRGMFYALKNDGSISVFSGTSNKLYNLNNTNSTWTDVSKASGTYSGLSSGTQWQFRQFNNYVFATQANAPLQVFDLTSSSAFADLGGSPPQAAYMAIVNRFVVLCGLASPNAYRVQWSGNNATTTWTSGTSESDYQDLADGGIVRGVAGGETGYIFQDYSIRRMTYSPGSPYVFGIDRISDDDGLLGPYSLITAGDRIFFYSPQGFKMLLPGGYPIPIGKEKVDRTFAADLDRSNLGLFIGASDPNSTKVFWTYKSIDGSAGLFDKIICYDWSLDRWSPITISGEYISSMSQPGITLEGVDSAYGSNIDTLTISSLDDISNSSAVRLSIANSLHAIGFLSGNSLEATLDTGEQGQESKRLFVRGFRPVTDASNVYGAIKYRENFNAALSTTSESLIDSKGYCCVRRSTRYARAQIRIPAASSWTFASGVEPDVGSAGTK